MIDKEKDTGIFVFKFVQALSIFSTDKKNIYGEETPSGQKWLE